MPRRAELTFPPGEEPPPLDDRSALANAAAAELGLRREAVAEARATRVSFDARRRHRVWRVALDVWLSNEAVPAAPATTPPTFERPGPNARHVAVIGSGPAGLFAALDLLAAGLQVTLLERGRDVQTRRKHIARLHRGEPADPDSNYCFGEGGAGTYSDGKLYARSGSKADVRGVLETLVAHGARPDILASWRPHVGSNRLPEVVLALRETILRSGGVVRFGHRAEELETTRAGPRPRIAAVVARNLDTDERARVACDAVVLATGHSALDALYMAERAGARLVPKGFAMGVRIEHPQAWLDERQYGGLRESCELPPSFYELALQADGRGVYSFCMCPGGFVVPTTTSPARVVLNGMSLSRRDSPFANSGLVVAIEPEDWCGVRGERWGWLELFDRARAAASSGQGASGTSDSASAPGEACALPAHLPASPDLDPLFGVRLQRALETLAAARGGGRNRAPSQRADLVAAGARACGPALATSYRPGVTPGDLAELLPRGILERLRAALPAFDARIAGFASEQGQVLGVETRTSSPVRIEREPATCESAQLLGLYPCGEGAGYAGGIVSAALDGRRAAAAIARALA